MMKKLLLGTFTILLLISCESATEKADRFFLKGNVALNEGKNEEAIRLYDEAISKNPRLKEAYNNKGVALYREGKFQEAIETYTDVLYNIDAYYMNAKKNRVDANLKIKNFEMVAKDLVFLAEAYPDSAFIPFKRGEWLMGLKAYGRAIHYFEISYERDSSKVDPLVNAAIGHFYMANFPKATEVLNTAMAKDPGEPNIYNTFAMIAIEEEKFDEAMTQVNKAISIDPRNPFYYNNRGYVHMINGDLDQAEADIKRAIQGDPENAWAYRNRGILLYKQNNGEGAIRNFEQAAKRDTTLTKMYAVWGDALYDQGNMEEACAKWRVSIDLFENDAREKVAEYCK